MSTFLDPNTFSQHTQRFNTRSPHSQPLPDNAEALCAAMDTSDGTNTNTKAGILDN